ncbi:hypothetical protein SJS42_18950 [Aeromonas caviae]|uniref:Uncharacterized protein n=1 Tax=Aeromonas veronii TaxID=654 RepID=A0AAW5MGK0_AERVE|nr:MULTISPECIES: hypothetical protein [Aeromonas]MCR4450689.1 hypothetical protein [Aeromonas veronii]MDX7789001.1 hypothetical protein [Aeromonas caviae]MDX7800713.1 hypothetical protein [Aeromonas caviae]
MEIQAVYLAGKGVRIAPPQWQTPTSQQVESKVHELELIGEPDVMLNVSSDELALWISGDAQIPYACWVLLLMLTGECVTWCFGHDRR